MNAGLFDVKAGVQKCGCTLMLQDQKLWLH